METSKFETVTVTYENEVTSVDKPSVTLYYDHPNGPNAIKWRIASRPPGAARVQILWDTAGPFGKVKEKDSDIEGTENLKKQATYHYAVLFVDAKGQVIGGVDPDVVNQPEP